MKKTDYTLKELLTVRDWQKIQDNFSAVTDVNIRTVDSTGSLINPPSKPSRFCSEILKNNPAVKEKICGSCLPTFLGGRGVVDKNLKITCDFGLCNFIAPLKINNFNVLGYIIAGPVILVMRKPKEYYLKMAEELNVSLEEFWGALMEIRVISTHIAQSLIKLIKDICENILYLGYMTLSEEKEEIKTAPKQLNKFLNALLDVAFQVSGADTGSIMFLDKTKEELTIRAAKGIPAEIVNSTKVKLGEGICGLVAKQKSSFLIDDSLQDNRIRKYLNRPNLKSSMVLPINYENRTLGVINLGSSEKTDVMFTSQNIRLMNKLLDLTVPAIQQFNPKLK